MTKFGLAQSVRRVEDPRLLRGGGRYTDDIVLPGMLHGIVVRSPHAAAKLGTIDTTAAASVAGVKAIYTAADLAPMASVRCPAPRRCRTATDQTWRIRHISRLHRARCATSATLWRSSLPRLRRRRAMPPNWSTVDYDIQPSITDMAHVTDADAPLVWPDVKQNIAFDWGIGDKAATDALFATAAHVTRLTVVNNRVVVASMEARAAIADYDPASDRWTLYANTQGGWLIKNLIGAVFNTEPAKFRVITPDVGGGFGMKAFLYPEHVLTCYAARKLGRPVKWASDRGEAFLADTQGRDNITLGELAIDRDNKFLALRTRNVANMGAYLSTFAPYIPTLAGGAVLSGVYGFQQIFANVLGVFTHTMPVDAYRGAGRPESNYCWSAWSTRRRANSTSTAQNCADVTWSRNRRCRTPLPSARHTTPATSPWCSTRRFGRWTTPALPPGVRRPSSVANAAALASRIILRSQWAIRPSVRKSASPTMASSTSMWVRNRPVRDTRPATSSSPRSASASTARRSASAKATPTPSRSAAAPVDHAAFIPKARPSF